MPSIIFSQFSQPSLTQENVTLLPDDLETGLNRLVQYCISTFIRRKKRALGPGVDAAERLQEI